jgi:hypothetical protein
MLEVGKLMWISQVVAGLPLMFKSSPRLGQGLGLSLRGAHSLSRSLYMALEGVEAEGQGLLLEIPVRVGLVEVVGRELKHGLPPASSGRLKL